jgi:hypothetical protein
MEAPSKAPPPRSACSAGLERLLKAGVETGTEIALALGGNRVHRTDNSGRPSESGMNRFGVESAAIEVQCRPMVGGCDAVVADAC